MRHQSGKALSAMFGILSVFALDHVASAQDGEENGKSRGERTSESRQDDAAGFGEDGQIAFSTDAELAFRRITGDGVPTRTTVTILPAFDYFVIENLSVGGVVGIDYGKTGDSRVSRFRLGPRVGYNIELSRLLSVWPKLGFSYTRTKAKNVEDDPIGDDETTVTVKNNALALNLYAPVMLHPAPHFFAGLGPYLDTDLNGDNRTTEWGFRLTLGGWL